LHLFALYQDFDVTQQRNDYFFNEIKDLERFLGKILRFFPLKMKDLARGVKVTSEQKNIFITSRHCDAILTSVFQSLWAKRSLKGLKQTIQTLCAGKNFVGRWNFWLLLVGNLPLKENVKKQVGINTQRESIG